MRAALKGCGLLAILWATGGCIDGGSIVRIPTGIEGMSVTALEVASVVVPGSVVTFRGTGFVTDEVGTARVHFDGVIDGRGVRLEDVPTYVSETEMRYTLSEALIGQLGTGHFEGDLSLAFVSVRTGEVFRKGGQAIFDVRTSLTPVVAAVEDGPIHLNDEIVLHGEGFLGEGEGTTEVVYDGSFTAEGDAEPRAVSGLTVQAQLAEPHARDRTLFVYPTSIGGIEPGTFTGRITVQNRHASGEVITAAPRDVVFEVGIPEVFGVDPPTATIGQILHVRGAGFVGGDDGDEVTIIRLNGIFEPAVGDPVEVQNRDFVPAFGGGQDLRYSILPRTTEEGRIVALDFNASHGTFRGEMVPIISKGTVEVQGEPQTIEFALGGLKQVVWVRFLPGFSDSVRLFGLHAVEAEIKKRVFDKFERVYEGINVEFQEEAPTEYDPAAYALLEIGGPDPNGEGLFGYDNTPGKDIGNVRLHDHVGGSNAAGAEDGYGYGGVFIESFFYFSDHPPFTGSRPLSSPEAVPEFDEIFDPVRRQEVTAGDWPAGSRAAEVELAIRTLANLVGDTASHEFGHSLGLAMPYGLPTQYHNVFDSPGCLMDAGGDRPFGERAELDGFDFGHFCGDELDYLGLILPLD